MRAWKQRVFRERENRRIFDARAALENRGETRQIPYVKLLDSAKGHTKKKIGKQYFLNH